MSEQGFTIGSEVRAATDIHNDGSLPELAEGALIAPSGTRGVVVRVGHLEENPEQALYLVRFADADDELGPPTGCWPSEISAP